MLNSSGDREKRQLIDGAELYLDMARRIKTDTKDHIPIDCFRLLGKKSAIFRKLAHLSSATIRICTLCEIKINDPKNNPYKIVNNKSLYDKDAIKKRSTVRQKPIDEIVKEVMKCPEIQR